MENKIIMKIILCLSVVSILSIYGCKSKNEKNQKGLIKITVKITDINNNPKIGDSVIIRERKPTFPMYSYEKTGGKVTDSLGETDFIINKKKGYRIATYGFNGEVGSVEYEPNKLQEKDTVIIKSSHGYIKEILNK
jgi:hypothetical protein